MHALREAKSRLDQLEQDFLQGLLDGNTAIVQSHEDSLRSVKTEISNLAVEVESVKKLSESLVHRQAVGDANLLRLKEDLGCDYRRLIDNEVVELEEKLTREIRSVTDVGRSIEERLESLMTSSTVSISELYQQNKIFESFTQYVDSYLLRLDSQLKDLTACHKWQIPIYQLASLLNSECLFIQSPIFTLLDSSSSSFLRLAIDSQGNWIMSFLCTTSDSHALAPLKVDLAINNLAVVGVGATIRDDLLVCWEAAVPRRENEEMVVAGVNVSLRSWAADEKNLSKNPFA
jgi:hypothetical protein